MKKRIIGFIMVLCMMGVLTACKGELQASEYVQADLNLIFQGETQDAKTFLDASDSELEQIYENGVRAFVENYILGEGDIGGTYVESYEYVVKEIFRAMKYRVEEAVEVDTDTYKVDVRYQPVDVFERYTENLKILSMELENKKNAGFYEGTLNEQEQAMLTEYLESAYELIQNSYLHMEYKEEEVFTFTVIRNKNNSPEMDEEEINQFIESILALDKL